MNKLDVPPSWKEFTEAVKDLTNEKYPGLNGVPPNAFKAMPPENLKVYFDFILKFWNDNLDFEEWHEGQVVPVPILKIQVIIPKFENEVEVKF